MFIESLLCGALLGTVRAQATQEKKLHKLYLIKTENFGVGV